MDVYKFKDQRPTPDKMFAYTEDLSGVPLIIDNGSYTAKVGWGTQADPAMVFRNLITKVRKDKTKKELETQIGNDIANLEAGRLNLRTQFDHGVVTHFEAQETLMDYSLTHLGVNTPGAVPHPIVISEPVANLNSSRTAMSELLFECYGAPSVCYFVDALASLRQNLPHATDALVISCGYHATHVIPVLDGRMDAYNARRISVGGLLMCSYLQRLLQLRYPAGVAAISMSRAEELLHHLCRLSVDYGAELRQWAEPEYLALHRRLLQLPVSAAASRDVTEPSPDAVRHRKKKAQARMLEMHRKKRLALVADAERELAAALSSGEVAAERIQELEDKVELARAKLASLASRREKAGKPPPADLQARVQTLERRRRELQERRSARQQRRAEMARRRTAASQQRMRIISQLAQKEDKEDTFGMRDEDWDLYKTINTEGGSASEADGEELAEVESRLRQLAPELPQPGGTPAPGAAELRQLPFTTEALQAPEVLFQPSLLGLDQAGVAETVQFVLGKYPAARQQRLAGCVFVTGGCGRLPGMKERLERELRQMRPFQTSFDVTVAEDPSLDAWRGARAQSAAGRLRAVSRQQYLDCGSEYLAEHPCSNLYCPTPAPEDAAGS